MIYQCSVWRILGSLPYRSVNRVRVKIWAEEMQMFQQFTASKDFRAKVPCYVRSRDEIVNPRASTCVYVISLWLNFSIINAEFDGEFKMVQKREYNIPDHLMIHDWAFTDTHYIIFGNRIKVDPLGESVYGLLSSLLHPWKLVTLRAKPYQTVSCESGRSKIGWRAEPVSIIYLQILCNIKCVIFSINLIFT